MLLTVILSVSCESISYMSRSVDISRDDASQVPLNAELKVNLDKKVNGVSDMQDSKKDALANAYYNCIQANNIDVVVDPIIKITKYSVFTSSKIKESNNAKWWKPQFKAEISGYGGKYVKIETSADQINQFANIDMNTIVKYQLVTNPDFYRSYYSNQKSNVINVYNDGNHNSKKGFKKITPSVNTMNTTPSNSKKSNKKVKK